MIIGSDDFNRADGAIDVGQAEWTAMGSNMPVVVSDHVKLGPDVDTVAGWNSTPTGLKTQYSKLKYVTEVGGAASITGPAVNLNGTDGTTRSFYMAGRGKSFASGNDTGFLIKKAGGANTTLASTSAGAIAGGDNVEIRSTISLDLSRVDLVFVLNGTPILTFSDTASDRLVASDGKVGIAAFDGDGTRFQIFDDWEGGTFDDGSSIDSSADFSSSASIPASSPASSSSSIESSAGSVSSESETVTPPRQVKNLQIFYKNTLRNI